MWKLIGKIKVNENSFTEVKKAIVDFFGEDILQIESEDDFEKLIRNGWIEYEDGFIKIYQD